MNYEQQPDGTYLVAIPEPYFVGFLLKKCRCDCGKVFKNRDLYRTHWRKEHGLTPTTQGE